MDNISGLFSLNGGQGLNGMDKDNHIQGLFHDLLGCLAGGDNPKLPEGYKQKPMTGFCDILDAFNETVKIREAGSGIVCEVGSSDIMSSERACEEVSDGTIKSSAKESVHTFNTTSLESIYSSKQDDLSDEDYQQCTSLSLKEDITHLPALTLSKLPQIEMTRKADTSDNSKSQNPRSEKDCITTSSETELYQDAFDFDGENPVLALLNLRENSRSSPTENAHLLYM